MAFKFIAFCSLLAFTNAGVFSPVTTYAVPQHTVAIANPAVDAVASTHQNVVRSFDGTVSTYSKAIDTPYSSVRKEDTRISNNVYTPAIAKAITYAAPVATKTLFAPAPTVAAYTHAAPVYAKASAPVVYSHAALTAAFIRNVATPVAANTITYAAPTITKTVLTAAPAPAVYTHAAPAFPKTVGYAAPVATTNFNHGPAATTYTHAAPGLSGYGTSQTIHYSPAELVSHMSFDGFGTHWGF